MDISVDDKCDMREVVLMGDYTSVYPEIFELENTQVEYSVHMIQVYRKNSLSDSSWLGSL